MIIEKQKLYSTGDEYLDELLEKAFCEGYELGQKEFTRGDYEGLNPQQQSNIILRQQLFTYEDDELEAYEELDSKKISKLTDNQKKMLLEDERAKAKRNQSRIVKKYGKKGEKEGREKGKKRGTKRGAIGGAIIGALGGAMLGHGTRDVFKGEKGGKRALIGAGIGGALGAGGGALIGRISGAESGAISGKARGEAKGRKIAKEQGHDDVDRTTKNARILDEYARTHKGKSKDDWEVGFRNQLKVEKKEREEAAERKRQAELERRRVEAEEARAIAERERSRTDRDRYYDEHFGWGQYGRDRHSGTSYTQNNYYR